MPLTRYQIRNEYGLADPELYRAADKDDPEALLEGVAMAGLVGVLRQLGDLAEFAAEIFHDLHEDLMTTAARGHGLMVRVQQLEAEFPSIEKAFLSQTSHSSFFYNTGIDWHPNLHMGQNLITQKELPRFVMDSYEECRGPPRLFLLDKFDVAGAGACLKRYTDPSLFKVETSSAEIPNAEVQREKKRKAKKKGSRWRNGETPDVLPASHAKLHQLFLEERVEKGINDPARRVKLKRKMNGYPFDSKTGKSYMERFLDVPSPDHKVVRDISVCSSPLRLPSGITGDSGLEIIEISAVSPDKESCLRNGSPYSSPDLKKTVRKPSNDEFNEKNTHGALEMLKASPGIESDYAPSTLGELLDEKEIAVDEDTKVGGLDGYQSDDIVSDIDYYVDALTTMDSEIETDSECRAKNDCGFLNIKKQETGPDAIEEQHELQADFSDSLSMGNSTASDDGNSSAKLAEKYPSEGVVSHKVLPSSGNCEVDTVNRTSGQCFDENEIPSTQPPIPDHSGGECIEVVEIPTYRSGIKKPSSSSSLTDVAHTQSPVEQCVISREDSPFGLELGEITSTCNGLVTKVISDQYKGVNGVDNLPCSSNLSDVPPGERDDSLPLVSAENCLVDELDDEDPNIFSDASLNYSNTLELAPKRKSGETLLGDIHPTEYAQDGPTKYLLDNHTDSPHLNKEAQPHESMSSPKFKNCNPDIKPNGVTFTVNDAISSAGDVTENESTVLCSMETRDFSEQLHGKENDVLPLELNSAEAGTSFSEEKSRYTVLGAVGGEELVGVISNNDIIGKDSVSPEFTSDSPDVPDLSSSIGVESHLNDVVNGTIQAEVRTLASAASTNYRTSQEKSHSRDGDSPKNLLGINEAFNSQHVIQSNTELERNRQAIRPSVLHSVRSNKVSYDYSNLDLPNKIPEPYKPEPSPVSLSSVESGHDSKLKPPQLSNLMEKSDDSVSSPNHYIPELKIPLEQKTELEADQHDAESHHVGVANACLPNLEGNQHANQSDQERHLDASEICQAFAPSPPSVPEILEQPRAHKLDFSKQATNPLNSHFPTFGILPEATQNNLEEMPPLPPLPPMQWRVGKAQHGSVPSETELGHHLFGQTSPKLLTTRASLPSETEFGQHLLRQNFPRLPTTRASLPSETEFGQHLLRKKFPSLPTTHASLPSETELGQDLFGQTFARLPTTHASLPSETELGQHLLGQNFPRLPTTADGKAQLDFPALERENSHLSNKLLPLPAEKDDQHVNGNLSGNAVHSKVFSSQVPAMVDHGNTQPNLLSSGRNETTNPFVTLPASYSVGCTHGSESVDGETQQSNMKPISPLPESLQEAVIQPLHQVSPERTVENENLLNTTILEEKVVNPRDRNLPPSKEEEEQAVSLTSEGEIPSATSTSTSLLDSEDGRTNGAPQVKIPRPRNPLIHAVVVHDKSKLRKVTDRVRPQIEEKPGERDSLLEQIRTKSFNLKPAVVTRPSIQGPQTNLKLAAILEKANAIRQAMGESDEDDDPDNWSDS